MTAATGSYSVTVTATDMAMVMAMVMAMAAAGAMAATGATSVVAMGSAATSELGQPERSSPRAAALTAQ